MELSKYTKTQSSSSFEFYIIKFSYMKTLFLFKAKRMFFDNSFLITNSSLLFQVQFKLQSNLMFQNYYKISTFILIIQLDYNYNLQIC